MGVLNCFFFVFFNFFFFFYWLLWISLLGIPVFSRAHGTCYISFERVNYWTAKIKWEQKRAQLMELLSAILTSILSPAFMYGGFVTYETYYCILFFSSSWTLSASWAAGEQLEYCSTWDTQRTFITFHYIIDRPAPPPLTQPTPQNG